MDPSCSIQSRSCLQFCWQEIKTHISFLDTDLFLLLWISWSGGRSHKETHCRSHFVNLNIRSQISTGNTGLILCIFMPRFKYQETFRKPNSVNLNAQGQISTGNIAQSRYHFVNLRVRSQDIYESQVFQMSVLWLSWSWEVRQQSNIWYVNGIGAKAADGFFHLFSFSIINRM